jgi:hypothetical protein
MLKWYSNVLILAESGACKKETGLDVCVEERNFNLFFT